MDVFKNGILLKFYSFVFLKHKVIQIILDTVSIFAALYVALYLSSFASLIETKNEYLTISLIVVCALQLLAFIVGGLYKRNVTLFGIGDFLQIVKSTFAAVVLTIIALNFLPLILQQSHIGISVMLDFYFLITLVVGSRVAFHILNYIVKREVGDSKKILIYGADQKGLMTLQVLLNNGVDKATPIGFLDDDPALEGKFLNGYPIFGGHLKLEGLLKKNVADEIILAKEGLNGNVFGRIRKIAGSFNIPVRTSKIKFTHVGNESKNNSRNIVVKKQRQKIYNPTTAESVL